MADPGRKKRPLLARIARFLWPTAVLFLVAEVGLRLAGYPTPDFNFLLSNDSDGLYPANMRIDNVWAYFHYRMETDELGLRGTGVPREGRDETARIVTIGDSVTDGFFVDNDGTYQHFLQRRLDDAYGPRYRVLNVARGGATIGEEYAVLRGIGVGLDPDVVVLTFVTNDIHDLRDRQVGELLEQPVPFRSDATSVGKRISELFFHKTAVGEMLFRALWHGFIVKRTYEPVGGGITPQRYDIPGGDDFAGNVEKFKRRHSEDAEILTETFAPEIQERVDTYTTVLRAFADTCAENGIAAVLAYYPSYLEVYDHSTHATMREHLQQVCADTSMHFLDLTETFRAQGADRVLHLAPVDYHLNPAGNEVLGNAVFEFLRERELVR